MQSAVRARGLTKRFGNVIALAGVELEVTAGRVHGLVGPNGAGKSTLLGLMLGLAGHDSGTLEVLATPMGRSLGAPPDVGGFVDGPGLYPSLTARQNLTALAALRGERDRRPTDADELLDRVGLLDVASDVVRGFSLGMRQRLGLAAALLGAPRLLVLDEPANGLDPASRRHVHQVLTDLVDEGATVVVSSHRLDDLAAVCDELSVLSAGRIAYCGSVHGLTAVCGTLQYRIVTTDSTTARDVAAQTPQVTLVPAQGPGRRLDDGIVVHASESALDELVRRLVGQQIAVRELAPVVNPLEAAYLALTEAAPAPAAARDLAGAAR